MVATLPGRTQGLGLITEPLITDLRIDRASYAEANLWATLIGSLFCVPCGRLMDKFGARIVLALTIVALALTTIGMTAVSGFFGLAIAITLTRGFGQSALSVVSLALVGKWFSKKLHFAMGVYSVLVGIGFIASFPSVGSAVLAFGWRAAWSGVGWSLLLVIAPIAWLFARNGPGTTARGDSMAAAASAANSGDFSLGEALVTPAFWIFSLSSAMFGLVYSGISLFNQSILEQRGFGPEVFHEVLVISTLLGLVANFAGGWVASRWPIQRLMGIGMAVLAAAVMSLPAVRSYWQVVMYGCAMGIAGGVVTVVFFSVWGYVYGRRHLGRIQGFAQMMTVFASAIGPLLLARTFERTGSYDGSFQGIGTIVAVLSVASWVVRMPAKRPEPLDATLGA